MNGNKIRKGKFYLDMELYQEDYDIVEKIFEQLKFVPYRVELRYDCLKFRLEGCSPLFKETDSYVTAPFYNVDYVPHRAEGGKLISIDLKVEERK